MDSRNCKRTTAVSYKSRGPAEAASATPDGVPVTDRVVDRNQLLRTVAAAMSDACSSAGCTQASDAHDSILYLSSSFNASFVFLKCVQ